MVFYATRHSQQNDFRFVGLSSSAETLVTASSDSFQGRAKLKSGVNEPSPFRTRSVTVSPEPIFFPPFLAINDPFGLLSSLRVPCSSPLTRITAPVSKFSPVTTSFLPVAVAPVMRDVNAASLTRYAPRPWVNANSRTMPSALVNERDSVGVFAKPVFSRAQLAPPSVDTKT